MIQFWEDIINTAIIGTDKKQVNKQLLPDELHTLAGEIEGLSGEKEEQFLGVASVLYNYRRSGFLPLKNMSASIPVCEEEEKKYCSGQATGALQAVLGDDNDSLLYYWLLQCLKKNQLVQPEYIPALLEVARKNKTLAPLITECNGKRGLWMQQFNPQWNLKETVLFKEVFETGKLDERKTALIQWREQSPQEARQVLTQVWKQEQAAVKAELLDALEINLGKEDEPFLQEAWKEKSVKVKEVALKLLKQIPDSFIVNEVTEFVKPLVTYKKTSGMLGLLSKETVELNLQFELPEHFKAYGISHLDANKIYSEKEFTLSQLLSFVPPAVWEKHFNMNAAQILELFGKKEETKKFTGSLAMAVNTFKNVEWGLLLYKHYKQLCMSVVKSFERNLQEEITLASLHENAKRIYDILPGREQEWSSKFTISLLEKAAQEPYTYTKHYYKQIIHHFPVTILEKLDHIDVTDPLKKNYWNGISEELKKMLAIKQQIIQSF